MTRSTCIIASLAICGMTGVAAAETVTAKYTGQGAGMSVNINGGSQWAGQLHYTLSNSGPVYQIDGQWITFCTELGQNTNGSNQTYQVMDLSDLPTPGQGMGEAKADLIAAMYYVADGAQYVSNNTYAAAFQVAIWEIVADFDGTLESLNLATGGLTSTTGGTFASTVADLLTAAYDSTAQSILVGLGNNSYQDQILELPGFIPAPGALALLGLAGVVAGRRRRA